MGGGGPSAPPPDYAGMWETVSKWQQDAAIDRERRLAEARSEVARMEARYTARGKKFEGGERLLEERTTAINKDFEDAMEKLKGSTNFQMLYEQYGKERKAAVKEVRTGQYRDVGTQAPSRFGGGPAETGTKPNAAFTGRDAGGDIKFSGDGMRGTGAYRTDAKGNAIQMEEIITQEDTWDKEKYGDTFETWAEAKYGKVKSSYDVQLTPEQMAQERAQAAAGGARQAAAGLAESRKEEAMNERNPWVQSLGGGIPTIMRWKAVAG